MELKWEDVLKLYMNNYMDGLHTSLPGKITEYDYQTKKASIKPLIKTKYPNGQALSLPIITNVPVIFPGTSEALISFPLVAGDGVLLVICEKSLDDWLSSQLDDVTPTFDHRCQLTDAFCIPGLFTFQNPGKIGNGEDLEILYRDASIRIKPDGNIELNGDSKKLVTYAALNSALSAFWTTLYTALTTTPIAGNGAPQPAWTGISPANPIDISAAETTTIKTGG